jgi:hypothetical protein
MLIFVLNSLNRGKCSTYNLCDILHSRGKCGARCLNICLLIERPDVTLQEKLSWWREKNKTNK